MPTPMLKVANISSSLTEPARCTSEKIAGSGQLPRRSRAPSPGGSARGTFSTNPPPVMCADGVEQSVAGEAEDRRCVDRARFEQLVDQRTLQPLRGLIEIDPLEQRRTDERVAVRVQPRRGQAEDDVSLTDEMRPE